MLAVGTRIATDEVELRDRHEQLGVVGIVDAYEFGGTFFGGDRFQPVVSAYAVGGVHDRIALAQFAHVANDRFDVGGAAVSAAANDRFRVVELGLGDDHQARLFEHKAARERPYGNRKGLRAVYESRKGVDEFRFAHAVAQQFLQTRRTTRACCDDKNAFFLNAALCDEVLQLGGWILSRSLDRKRCIDACFGGFERNAAEGRNGIEKVVSLVKELFGGERRSLRIVREKLVALLRLTHEGVDGVSRFTQSDE